MKPITMKTILDNLKANRPGANTTHTELDKEWKKLTKEYKAVGLTAARRAARVDKERIVWNEARKEAEKGKQVGKECTCIPDTIGNSYREGECSFCKHEYDEMRINHPG